MSNLMGALVGAAIDRRDGDSGIKGAIIGTVAESAIRLVVPVVATWALGWAVQYGIRKAWRGVAGRDPVDARDGALQAWTARAFGFAIARPRAGSAASTRPPPGNSP